VPLQIASYPNATRFPFEAVTAPGLAIAGNGRGCNQDFGQFTVLDIVYDASGNVSRFAADFEQHCETPTAPALVGAIRYNSDVPVPGLIVPSIAVNSPPNPDGCYEATSPTGALVPVTGSAVGGANLSFTWSTSTGGTGSEPQFSVAVGLRQYVTLMLTATDTVTGNSATTSHQPCSSDTTPPTVTIRSPLPGAALTKLPTLDVQVTDAVDRKIASVSVAVGQNSTYGLNKTGQLHTEPSPQKGHRQYDPDADHRKRDRCFRQYRPGECHGADRKKRALAGVARPTTGALGGRSPGCREHGHGTREQRAYFGTRAQKSRRRSSGSAPASSMAARYRPGLDGIQHITKDKTAVRKSDAHDASNDNEPAQREDAGMTDRLSSQIAITPCFFAQLR
jgi:hypothetical protein